MKTNLYQFYKEKNRDDLASYAFEMIKGINSFGQDAFYGGHSPEVVEAMHEVDSVMFFYIRRIMGFAPNNRGLNIALRNFCKEYNDEVSVGLLFSAIYTVYCMLKKRELYEAITNMIEVNGKTQKVIHQCLPTLDSKYLKSPQPEYYAGLIIEKYNEINN